MKIRSKIEALHIDFMITLGKGNDIILNIKPYGIDGFELECGVFKLMFMEVVHYNNNLRVGISNESEFRNN